MSTLSHHPSTAAGTAVPGIDGGIRLLLIEDDPGDAMLVEDQLADTGLDVDITHARSLREAREKLTRRIQCVVADLSLPDAGGLDLLEQVLKMTEHAAVVVLTGRADSHLGVQAVALGAEDYLIKQEVDGPLLARAIRYAIERKRAEESERRLVEARIVSRENSRLERGLLPVPIIDDASLSHHTRYEPGRRRALLGGDFFDTVQTPDGAVHLVIGDVCGHGPDEAALGVQLRMAWRTLVLAGHTGDRLLATLDSVLGHERRSDEIFTTLCMITVAPSRRSARVYLAGHPAPLLFAGDEVIALPEGTGGPALGLLPGARWPGAEIELGDSWGLMLYTDGLIEGRVGPGTDRLGTDGLLSLARRAHGHGATGGSLVDRLVEEVEALNGDVLTDDLAVLLLSRGQGAARSGGAGFRRTETRSREGGAPAGDGVR